MFYYSSIVCIGLIPSRFGAMPPLVQRMDLRGRIRARCAGLGDRSLALDYCYYGLLVFIIILELS